MADEAVPSRLAGLVAMSSGDTRLDTLIRLTCGRGLSLPPLPTEVDVVDGQSDGEAVVAAFAEQFAIDVSGIGARQRIQLVSALGDKAFRTVVAIFIADFVPRVWAGLDALGIGKPGNGGPPEWDHDTDPIDPLLTGFVPAVARLRTLDPVMTEVVRLRGAVQHNCRLCKSRHGWMLELDGARMASSSASSTSSRGTGLSGRNMRVEQRSLMAWSRSYIVLLPPMLGKWSVWDDWCREPVNGAVAQLVRAADS